MTSKPATIVLPADEDGIEQAVQMLRDGGLVAIPTETVYGLAARADSDEAVARIFDAKGRPSFNPLIVHLADIEQAEALAEIDEGVRAYARSCWPGPVTLVLPRRLEAPLAKAVTAGLDSVALRVPRHEVARSILAKLGVPLAAPSANRSGFTSPTTPAHVLATLNGKVDLILDAGPCEEGVESTILKWGGDGRWERLRPGPASVGDEGVNGIDATTPTRIEAPGQLASHYSPGKPVRLNATEAMENEFMIGFGAIKGNCTLSAAADLAEAARQLYTCLHLAVQSEMPRVAVAPVPATGIGVAINDRLKRAAA